MAKFKMILTGLIMSGTLAGCAPLVVGAGGAVLADKVAEDQNGGDGLF